MRSSHYGTSPSSRTPRSIFSSEFLQHLEERDGDSLTATEAVYAGPWKTAPVPGRPGHVAVLRAWESLDAGDTPMGVFLHEEWAALFAALLPLAEGEVRFHLGEEAAPEGYPILAVFDDSGPQVVGWLPIYAPQLIERLHLLVSLAASPAALAAVMGAAGSAPALSGRILAEAG